MTDFNVQYSAVDIIFIVGDTIVFSYTVQKYNEATEEWEDYDMTGMQLDINFKRLDGLLMKSLSSAGASPEITIVGATYSCNADGFKNENLLNYDVQLTNGSTIQTIQRGHAKILKEITT